MILDLRDNSVICLSSPAIFWAKAKKNALLSGRCSITEVIEHLHFFTFASNNL